MSWKRVVIRSATRSDEEQHEGRNGGRQDDTRCKKMEGVHALGHIAHDKTSRSWDKAGRSLPRVGMGAQIHPSFASFTCLQRKYATPGVCMPRIRGEHGSGKRTEVIRGLLCESALYPLNHWRSSFQYSKFSA